MYRTRPSQATPRAYISAHDYWCEPLDYLSGSLSRYNAFFFMKLISMRCGVSKGCKDKQLIRYSYNRNISKVTKVWPQYIYGNLATFPNTKEGVS